MSNDVRAQWGQHLHTTPFNIHVGGLDINLKCGVRYTCVAQDTHYSASQVTGTIEGWYLDLMDYIVIMIWRKDDGSITHIYSNTLHSIEYAE